ncbi:MAG TPA: HYR domain-containing protein, partial [Pyrinomonadaceae bacterium]
PNNVDAGNRIAINDGAARSAVAGCIVQNGVRGIGLLSQGAASDPAAYPIFVPVDWQAAPVTIRLRRYANGDAEIVEVNGVAPTPRALLTSDKAPPPVRAGFASVEFGTASVEGKCTVQYTAFRSEKVVCPAGTTLDPNNPGANFTQEGGQTFTPGNVLTLTDTSQADFIAFFAGDGDAAAGQEIDVVTTFKIDVTFPVNAEVGNRVVINDGAAKSAIAACIIQNGVRGIGLKTQGLATDPTAYPIFVPIDWQAAPVRIRLRRYANGDAEIMELNGVAPTPRALLTADKAPPPTRTFPSVEFGTYSVEAQCTTEYSVFRTEKCPTSQPPNQAPIAQCQNRTVSADSSCLANVSIDNGSFDPDAGDTITVSQSPAGPYSLGTTNVTLTVTDNHGATSSCMATVTVVDTTPPTIAAPPDLHVGSGPNATGCGVVISDATLGTASAGDNCSAVSISRSGVPAGNFFPIGTTIVTYTANDGSNTNMVTQKVTVTDNTPPRITAPASSSAAADMNCQAQIPNVLPQVSPSDNCGAVTLSQSPAAGTLVGVGPQTITITAKDSSNNSSSVQTTFTVVGGPGFTISVSPNTLKRGGTVTLSAAFNNCASSSQALTLKVSLTRPGSNTLMVTLPLTLRAGQRGSLSIPVPIPKSTPTGLYALTLEWYIGGVKIGNSTAQLTVTA